MFARKSAAVRRVLPFARAAFGIVCICDADGMTVDEINDRVEECSVNFREMEHIRKINYVRTWLALSLHGCVFIFNLIASI